MKNYHKSTHDPMTRGKLKHLFSPENGNKDSHSHHMSHDMGQKNKLFILHGLNRKSKVFNTNLRIHGRNINLVSNPKIANTIKP